MCVGVCMSMYVCVCADLIIMVFVPGVECQFLCVCSVMRGLFEGMCLGIVVVGAGFVASVVLSLLINDFICS